MARETFRCEWVRCGNSRCGSCPHGPYWYAYWREGKRTKKRYVGKDDPRVVDAPPPVEPVEPVQAPDWREPILHAARASAWLARKILGVHQEAERDECARAFRRLSLLHHPDRGGDRAEYIYVIAAWSYLRAIHRDW